MKTEAPDNIFEPDLFTVSSIESDRVSGDGTTPEPEGSEFQQGPWAIAAWSIIYAVVVIVGFLGNVGICWIVFSVKRMRTVTNYFLANTAFADAFIVVFNTVFNFTYAINGDWYFGKIFCHFINFLPVGSICVSILSIAIISLDRFRVIIYPFRKRISKKQGIIVLILLWMFSLGLSFPQAFYAEYIEENISNTTIRGICYVNWPEGPFGYYHKWYQSMFMFISYFLPLSILAVSYIIIAKRLWGATACAVGEMNDSHRKKQKSNRKAVKMMMFVVVSFAICWLPYQTYFVVGFTYPNLVMSPGGQKVYLAVFWLAMSSTVYNPFIYCWINQRFRNEFKNLLLLRCQCTKVDRTCQPGCSRGETKLESVGQRTEYTVAPQYEDDCL